MVSLLLSLPCNIIMFSPRHPEWPFKIANQTMSALWSSNSFPTHSRKYPQSSQWSIDLAPCHCSYFSPPCPSLFSFPAVHTPNPGLCLFCLLCLECSSSTWPMAEPLMSQISVQGSSCKWDHPNTPFPSQLFSHQPTTTYLLSKSFFGCFCNAYPTPPRM